MAQLDLPRTWKLYFDMMGKRKAGTTTGLRCLSTIEEVDQLGGCLDSFWDTSASKPPKASRNPESHKLLRALEEVEPLSYEELAVKINGIS